MSPWRPILERVDGPMVSSGLETSVQWKHGVETLVSDALGARLKAEDSTRTRPGGNLPVLVDTRRLFTREQFDCKKIYIIILGESNCKIFIPK